MPPTPARTGPRPPEPRPGQDREGRGPQPSQTTTFRRLHTRPHRRSRGPFLTTSDGWKQPRVHQQPNGDTAVNRQVSGKGDELLTQNNTNQSQNNYARWEKPGPSPTCTPRFHLHRIKRNAGAAAAGRGQGVLRRETSVWRGDSPPGVSMDGRSASRETSTCSRGGHFSRGHRATEPCLALRWGCCTSKMSK